MKKTSYQDAHLDLLIRMAFEQLEEEDTEQLATSPDPELSAADALRADRAFDTACNKVNIQEKQEKRQKRKGIILHGFRTIGFVAAAIVILALIALPVTFAASAEFRQAVMKLFVEIDEERGEAYFSFQPEETNEEIHGTEATLSYETTTAVVPDCWTGNYYPVYLQKDFEVNYFDEFFHTIELVASDNRRILFSELNENITEMRGTEGATVDTILIQGKEATIIDGWHNNIHNVTIVWPADDDHTWFDLVTYGIETEETIRIAESVTKIDKQ